MAVRLFLRDNTDGTVHEYGDNCHDSLVLMEDGSLHYTNMQSCTGTMFPEEGYSFCDENGNNDFDYPETRERIYDIGGYQSPAWISTKDRLPEVGQDILAYYGRGFTVLRLDVDEDFNRYYWVDDHEDRYEISCTSVTAWMPLPEPYEEEKE